MAKKEKKIEAQGWRARLGQAEEAPPWRFFDVLNSFFALFLAMVLIGTMLSQIFFTLVSPLADTSMVLLLGWSLGGVIGGGFLYFLRRRDEKELNALRLIPTKQPAIFLVLLGIGFGILVDLIVLAGTGGASVVAELTYAPQYGLAGWVLAVLFLVIVQPIAEELLFRGMLHPYLRALIGGWPGLVLTAILYAVFHLLIYGNPTALDQTSAWRELIAPFAGGLLLGGVRATSGSTRAAMLVHAGMGAFAIMGALVLLNG